MKPAVLIITTLLVSAPLVAVADSGGEGPVELNEAGLDAITAGSISVPPTAALSALADASGDFAMTGTNAVTYVQDKPTPLVWGYASDWITAARGLATATTIGPDSTLETRVLTTPEAAAPNPYGGTINYTHRVLNTEITVFAQVRPGGPLLDWFHYRATNIWGFPD